MQIVRTLVDRKGAVTIKTEGFEGEACKAASRPYEEALGVKTSDVPIEDAAHEATAVQEVSDHPEG